MKRPFSGYRYIIEAIIFLTYVFFGMTWAAAGSFLGDIMQDLSIGLSKAGFINTSVSAAKILGPMIAGALLAKVGIKRAFLIASFLISLGVLAPLSKSFGQILASRFLMGLGGALVVVYFTPIVMEWFDEHERVVVNGLNFVSVSIGMTIGLAATKHIRVFFDGSWRHTLFLYSCVSIGLLLLWFVLGRDKDKKAVDARVNKQDQGSFRSALLDPNSWKLVVAYFGLLSVYLVIITYGPQYYSTSPVFAASKSIYLVPSVSLITSIPSSFFGMYVSKRIGLRIPLLRIAGIIVIPGVCLMFFSHTVSLVFIGAALTGFGMFFWRSALFSIPQELPGSTSGKSGYMMSVFWAVCYILATFNTWLTGKIIEGTGSYTTGFLLVVVLSGSMLVGSFIIPETGRGAGIKRDPRKESVSTTPGA